MVRPRMSAVLDYERLCAILGVKAPEFWANDNEGWLYVKNQKLQEGASEEEAEQAASDYEQEECDEAERRYRNAVEFVATKLFLVHGLELHEHKDAWHWQVMPEKSWKDALRKIIITINGVGFFHVSSIRDLCEGCNESSVRRVVLTCLHHIQDWPRVYGEGTTSGMIDRRFSR